MTGRECWLALDPPPRHDAPHPPHPWGGPQVTWQCPGRTAGDIAQWERAEAVVQRLVTDPAVRGLLEVVRNPADPLAALDPRPEIPPDR